MDSAMGVTVNGISEAIGTMQGVVPAETLRLLPELIDGLGHDGARFLIDRGVDPELLSRGDRPITGFQLVHLLEDAAAMLHCPDIGMRLAARQRGVKMGNLFELVMKNSPTVGDALRFCAGHVRTYSGSVTMGLTTDSASAQTFVQLEFLLPQIFSQGQAAEHMMLRTCNIISEISCGAVWPREVRFTHGNLASAATYRQQFHTRVRFGQPESGLWFDSADLTAPVPNADPQIHQLATFFIEKQFRARAVPIAAQVRALVCRQVESVDCTSETIAIALGLQLRTLQRRLREEGTNFEAIRDSVRREIALQCLARSRVPLSRVAEMLGYAESSAFSRSCHRWFSASPRELRKRLSHDHAALDA